MQIFHLVWTAAAGLRRWNGLGGGSGVTMTAASCPKTPRILRGARQNPAAGRHFSGFFGLKSSSLFDIVKNKQQKQRIAVSVRSFARVRLRPGASIGVMRRHAASQCVRRRRRIPPAQPQTSSGETSGYGGGSTGTDRQTAARQVTSSTASIQWRTGLGEVSERCSQQPMLAV